MLIHAGVLLLAAGMIAVVGGVLVTALFRPGTWIIALAFVCIAAGGVLNVVSALRAGATDSPDGSPG